MSSYYHKHPVKLVGVGPMGWWFQHAHRKERYLVPSAGRPVSTCVKGEPFGSEECQLCGWTPLVYKCGGSCELIRSGGCS